jgi:hypothetical protein
MAPFEGHALKTKNINPRAKTDRPIVLSIFILVSLGTEKLYADILEWLKLQ